MKKIKKQQNKIAIKKVQESIDTKIAKAVSAEKRISERIFGYVPYEISFIKATYIGKTQRPAKITAIERGIIGILQVDETSSFVRIGSILGLDVVHDKAEEAILRSAFNTLLSFNAIEGDDSCMALTENGRIYAEKGERPDTYSKSFDIYVDAQHPSWLNIKNCLGERYNEINLFNTPCEDLNLSLDKIKSYAEHQAQDVHFPQNRYLLENATWNNGHEASYKVYVCFVQNVANNEDVRVFVYDEISESLNELIADQINKDESLKSELLGNCIRLECENDEETTVLEGEAVETAKAEITDELKEAEQKIIKEDSGEEISISDEELESKENRESSADNTTHLKTQPKDRLHKKALYDSLSFEVELQKIFTEDDPDEVWLISPWIRKGAFLHDRGPMIENFLRDENKRVFIAYSEPATNNDGKPMMDEEVEPGIKLLEEQYSNFFYVQLPEFHLKNVIEVKGDQKILFSGSFNVLSFSVSEQHTHVRREEMALAHHTVARKKYDDCLFEFAEIYANRIMNQVESLDVSEIANFKNEKLDYFLGLDNAEIHKLFSPIEDLLEEKNIAVIKSQTIKSLTTIGQQLVAASNMGGLNARDKKKLESELAVVEKTISEYSINDPSILERLTATKESYEKIPLKHIFPSKTKAPQAKSFVRTDASISDSNNSFSLDDKALSIINGDDPSDEKEMLLLLVSLFFSSFKRLINKGELRKILKHIVFEMPNLYSSLVVEASKNNEETVDITLVVSNHSVIFRNIYLGTERPMYEQRVKSINRETYQTWVTSRNVESILANLLK